MADNPERVTYFAATDARGKHVPFGIKSKDRSKHMYIIGKTGMGKSTLLENMAIQDIRNGEGIGFIDPHGETANKLLDYIPKDRIKDVVYFAPFDMEHPIAFNVMEDVGYDKRHLVVSGLMATFKKIWLDAWSARMEYILTNTLLALLEYPGATLLGVNRMYTDKAYRTKVIDNVKDPVVKDFWTKEFANYGDRYTQEATPAIQNKIGQFTGNPLIRNIIGQEKSSFDIRTMMDQKKIIIMNLSKGLVGETNMRLLGSMLTTRIFLAAMSRAEVHGEELRKLPNFYFYVDEFQNFANETFAEILSEARKYHLNLTIAHQYIEQMEEEVRDAVFGNVGSTIAFRVGPFDAEALETIFMPEFTKEDLSNLGLRQIYLTLMIDGVGSRPFSASTLPPIEAPPVKYYDEVIASSRAQFTTPRANIESAIMKELTDSLEAPAPLDARMRRKPPNQMRRVLENQGQEIREPRREFVSSVPRGDSLPPLEEKLEPPEPLRRTFVPPPAPREVVREPRPAYREQSPPRPFVNAPLPPVERQPQLVRPQPTPPPSQKTADELKSILRTMTTNTSKEKVVQKTEQQQSLKGALAEVLKKAVPPSGATHTAVVPPQKQTSLVEPKLELKSAQAPEVKKPFEIPEEELRKILKGEG